MSVSKNSSKKLSPQQFFQELFKDLLTSGKRFIEVRKINHKTNRVHRQFCEDLDSLFEAIKKQAKGTGCYFGVHPRDKRDGTAAAVSVVTCLYADLDYKDFPKGKREIEGIFDALTDKGLPPTTIIKTGNGFHAYWLLEEAKPADDSYSQLLKDFQSIIRSDPVHDLPRIMRTPGTQNYKDPKNPKTCKIISADYSRRYSLADFETFIHDSGDETETQEDAGEGEIREGERNKTLTSLAGSMRRGGMRLLRRQGGHRGSGK